MPPARRGQDRGRGVAAGTGQVLVSEERPAAHGRQQPIEAGPVIVGVVKVVLADAAVIGDLALARASFAMFGVDHVGPCDVLPLFLFFDRLAVIDGGEKRRDGTLRALGTCLVACGAIGEEQCLETAGRAGLALYRAEQVVVVRPAKAGEDRGVSDPTSTGASLPSFLFHAAEISEHRIDFATAGDRAQAASLCRFSRSGGFNRLVALALSALPNPREARSPAPCCYATCGSR
jgi:hypothetical protein